MPYNCTQRVQQVKGGEYMVEMSKAEEVMQSYKELDPIGQAIIEGALLGMLTVRQQEKSIENQAS